MGASKIGLDKKGRMRIFLVLPIPPSDNNIYSNSVININNRWIPTRQLTQEARAYKKRVLTKIAGLSLKNPAEFKQNVEYECIIRVYFEKVYNKGWPKTAKSRYKKEDAQDRIKLVTDAISEAIGIDDSHHFLTKILKFEDRNRPRIVVLIREREARDG